MAVTQLIYYSRGTSGGDDRSLLEQLRRILAVSRTNNARDGITGYLVFDKTWFIQILEGDEAKVRATYNRIQTDSRHGAVMLVSQREVRGRSFPQWSMGGSMPTPDKQEIFLRHGLDDQLDPRKLSAPSILALAMDLQDYDLAARDGRRALAS